MTVEIRVGDCRELLKAMPDESVDCVVTSPPYWGLRDYGVVGQIGMERTLGEHLSVMVDVFREVRRVLRKDGTCWVNYGDCYATTPNGRSAADTKAAGNDDRTFRDKPFSTIGPINGGAVLNKDRSNVMQTKHPGGTTPKFRVEAGGFLKPKDLCMVANRLAIALQDDGWWIRSEIIWAKPNPMPESITDRPACQHEKVWLITKSPKYWYDAKAVLEPASESTHARVSQNVADQIGSERANGGRKTNGNMKAVVRKQDGHGRRIAGFNARFDEKARVVNSPKIQEAGSGNKNNSSFIDAIALVVPDRNLRNVWTIPTAAFSEAHFATFPPALVEPCIKAGCPEGGVVLDPFGGAGTVGLVADRLQRHAILLELNPEYAAISERRLRQDGGMFIDIKVASAA